MLDLKELERIIEEFDNEERSIIVESFCIVSALKETNSSSHCDRELGELSARLKENKIQARNFLSARIVQAL